MKKASRRLVSINIVKMQETQSFSKNLLVSPLLAPPRCLLMIRRLNTFLTQLLLSPREHVQEMVKAEEFNGKEFNISNLLHGIILVYIREKY